MMLQTDEVLKRYSYQANNFDLKTVMDYSDVMNNGEYLGELEDVLVPVTIEESLDNAYMGHTMSKNRLLRQG